MYGSIPFPQIRKHVLKWGSNNKRRQILATSRQTQCEQTNDTSTS